MYYQIAMFAQSLFSQLNEENATSTIYFKRLKANSYFCTVRLILLWFHE